MTGQGSTGNVVAAVCSFFFPGLGQLVQGRIVAALLFFLLTSGCGTLAGVLTSLTLVGGIPFAILGVALWLWGIVDAAVWRPRR